MAEAIVNNTSFANSTESGEGKIAFKGYSNTALSVGDRVFISPKYLEDGSRETGDWMDLSSHLIWIKYGSAIVYEYSSSTNLITEVASLTLSGFTGGYEKAFKLDATHFFVISLEKASLYNNYYGSLYSYNASNHSVTLIQTRIFLQCMSNGIDFSSTTSYCAVDTRTIAISGRSSNGSSNIRGNIAVAKISNGYTSFNVIDETYISNDDYPNLQSSILISINKRLYACNDQTPYYIRIPSSTSGSLSFTQITSDWLRHGIGDGVYFYSGLFSRYSFSITHGGPGRYSVSKVTASGSSVTGSVYLRYDEFPVQEAMSVHLNDDSSIIALITRSFEYDTSDYRDYYITLIDASTNAILLSMWPYLVSERYAFNYSGGILSDRFIGKYIDLANLQKVDGYSGCITSSIGTVSKNLGNGYYEVSF